MSSKEQLIQVGIISSAYGLGGQVAIKSFTDPAHNIMQYNLKNSAREHIQLYLVKTLNKQKMICRIDKIQTRTEAEQKVGTALYVYKHELIEIKDASEYYIVDLIGVPVKNKAGSTIGKICNVYNYGAGDIIEVEYDDCKNVMYPFTKEIFPTVTKDFVILIPPNFI